MPQLRAVCPRNISPEQRALFDIFGIRKEEARIAHGHIVGIDPEHFRKCTARYGEGFNRPTGYVIRKDPRSDIRADPLDMRDLTIAKFARTVPNLDGQDDVQSLDLVQEHPS